jgi:hypothetical protein
MNLNGDNPYRTYARRVFLNERIGDRCKIYLVGYTLYRFVGF